MRLLRRLMLFCALTAISCGAPQETQRVDELTGEVLLEVTATHDMHRLMEDADLTGGASITPEQVQQFLQQKGSYLAGYRDPVWSNKTAATLIVERSRAYSISPLYILARIQIESGLIQSGTSNNLAKATGCGCPDSGGCNVSYSGFGNQVECGAAKIRNYLKDLDAGRTTVSGWKVGLTKQTLDPCTVTPATKATAALYTYTPWVGAYAVQCGYDSVGGSSLVAEVFKRYRSEYAWGACTVGGAILTRYNQLGGSGGFLGSCVTSELATPDGAGRYNHFQNGSIYWTQNTGAWEVWGQIRIKWEQLGWERSVLGYPITGELTTPDGAGRYNHFQNGSIYWTQATGAWEIHGDIRAKWEQLGWEKSNLGYPTSGELATPDGAGRYNHFENGSIYWTQTTGAREVRGLIHAKWAELGWEKSYLGYPTTDEQATADGVGRFNHFQRGSIYFTPATGAHEVIGDINTKWVELGRQAGLLGYPLTDETKTPDGVGRFNHFQNGSIYWTPTTGAHEVHGPIRAKWESLGWETGALGYPVRDEYAVTGGRESEFQKGFLMLNTATNTVTVRMK
ncbi:LGFP repeat-containing protein [Archangium gephyra]|uniref:LGFP repeat-containing protein n=1 Tax=Archangium gephyra TaxID=48 RepID=UPI0035D520B5